MLIKEIILKKYKDVRLNTIERNLQGEEAIAYLEYVSRELGDVILIERLKIAGYFVTDRNKIGFNKKNKIVPSCSYGRAFDQSADGSPVWLRSQQECSY